MDWDRVVEYPGRGHFMARASDVLSLERDMALITWRPKDLQDPAKTYTPVHIADLQKSYSMIDWKTYFEGTLNAQSVDALSNLTIIDVTPSYMDSLMSVLQQHSTETIRYYMIWRFLLHYTDRLSDEFRKPMQDFDQLIKGTSTFPPRWRQCVDFSTDAMGFVAGKAFVDRKFSKDSKVHAEQMVTEIRISFRKHLEQASWLDAETKAKALLKESTIRQLIAYPDFLFNDTYMNTRYRGLKVDEEGYFKNAVNIAQFEKAYEMSEITRPVDRNEWLMFPQEINAYYSPRSNKIAFPAGILQPPFWQSGASMAANFGGIGTIMGHEVTHGFDNHGRLFDGDGMMQDWWSNSSQVEFQNATKCFIDQYAQYDATLPTYAPRSTKIVKPASKTDSTLTLGETLADNGGLRVAWDAWKSSPSVPTQRLPGLQHIPDDQLFFLSFAQNWCTNTRPQDLEKRLLIDEHPAPWVRVNGAVSNSQEFQRAYQCGANAKMNPSKRCSLW